jgi:hypothetical protein
MKWIGQHIYDLISRFRSDVYLEDISSGTIASGGNLGLDSNNKIVKQSDTGITDLHGAGVDGFHNQLLTDDGDGTVTSEANLTFDGSTLSVEADANTTANALFIDANSLTAGSAISIDVDDATTITNDRDLLLIDFDKSGVTADGASVITTGLKIDIDDNATNHANSVQTYFGVESHVTWASTNGTNTGSCFYGNIGGGSASTSVTGLLLDVVNGGADIKIRSSADAGDFCTIATGAHGATTLTTVDDDATAAHFEIAADGDITLDSAGQIKLEPVAGNNILLDGTVTVDGGSVTGITTLGVDSVSLTAVQTSSESFADNDTSIMTSAAIDDHINKKSIRTYGDTIKLLFSDFLGNEDGGATKAAPIFDDDGGNIGMKPGSNSTMLYAITDIPEGKKATHVHVYGNNNKTVDVYELNVNASTGSSLPTTKGTGAVGSELDFSSNAVSSTATNFLVVRVSTTATSDRIYGALITTADI